MLVCSSPQDGIIERMEQLTGHVTAGDIVALVSSPDLKKFKSRVTSFHDFIDIQERPFLDGRIDLLLASFRSELSAVKEAETLAAELFNISEQQFKAGVATSVDVLTAHSALTAKRARVVAVQALVDQEPKRVEDAKAKPSLARQQLLHERDILESLEQELTIKAARDGVFTATVGVGSFVKKGHTIGVIE